LKSTHRPVAKGDLFSKDHGLGDVAWAKISEVKEHQNNNIKHHGGSAWLHISPSEKRVTPLSARKARKRRDKGLGGSRPRWKRCGRHLARSLPRSVELDGRSNLTNQWRKHGPAWTHPPSRDGDLTTKIRVRRCGAEKRREILETERTRSTPFVWTQGWLVTPEKKKKKKQTNSS